jgi:hypothetical protein
MYKNKKININDLVGLKIEAIKGYKQEKGDPTEIGFILFDDKETFIKFQTQDYYEYHDCSDDARQLYLFKDKAKWEKYMIPNKKNRPGLTHCNHIINYILK